MTTVSVLLPSYNHEKYISETIESVLNQTFKDFECIIIDDHSTDNSVEIIKKYAEKDERIRFFIHKTNMGIAKTENELIDLARGKFIAFLNSDDVWDEKKLEKQFKVLEKNENLVVWTEGEIIDKKSKPTGRKFTNTVGLKRKKKSGTIFNSLLRGNFILFASLMFKKEILNGLRFIENLKIINDYPFELSLAKKYKYYFISEPLTKYRMHGKNTIIFTEAKKLRFLRDIIIVYRHILENYEYEIPKLLKWFYNFELTKCYIDYGLKVKSRIFIYKMIKIEPFNLLNYWYLANTVIENNSLFSKILKKTNRFFNFIEKIYRIKVFNPPD